MRHRNAGWKLGRNTSHRRALLRNLVTALVERERIKTTVAKAKAMRPHVEKMITLGKAENLHSRRQAPAYLQTPAVVKKVNNILGINLANDSKPFLHITGLGWRKGD